MSGYLKQMEPQAIQKVHNYVVVCAVCMHLMLCGALYPWLFMLLGFNWRGN